MITNADYMQIVSEAYDLSDPYIKKKVIFCNEAKRQENIENIVGRLYTHIKNDVTGIDFGTIPRSKGIITKIDNYNGLKTYLDANLDQGDDSAESIANAVFEFISETAATRPRE